MTAVPSALVIFRGKPFFCVVCTAPVSAWLSPTESKKNSVSRPANIKEISPNQRGANVAQVRVLFIWCIHIVLSEDVGKRYSRKSDRL